MDWEQVAKIINPLAEKKIKVQNDDFEISYFLPEGALTIAKQIDVLDPFIFKVVNSDATITLEWHGKMFELPAEIYDIFLNARVVQNEYFLCPLIIIDIQKRWFDLLLSGKKIVEGKKGTPKWANIEAKDIIVFRSEKDHHVFKVVTVVRYSTLKKYLKEEGLEKVLPGVTNIEEGMKIYQSAPISWTEKEIEKYGILAIHVKKY